MWLIEHCSVVYLYSIVALHCLVTVVQYRMPVLIVFTHGWNQKGSCYCTFVILRLVMCTCHNSPERDINLHPVYILCVVCMRVCVLVVALRSVTK